MLGIINNTQCGKTQKFRVKVRSRLHAGTIMSSEVTK
jgi:hypothetical protein